MLNMAFTNNNRGILLTFKEEISESVLDILSYPEFAIRPTMVGQEKNFQNGGSYMAGKSCFEIGFCKNSISKESNLTNILRRIYRKCLRHSCVFRV